MDEMKHKNVTIGVFLPITSTKKLGVQKSRATLSFLPTNYYYNLSHFHIIYFLVSMHIYTCLFLFIIVC